MPESRCSRLGRTSHRYRFTVGRETRAPQSRSGASNETSISRLGSGTAARRNASRDSSSRCSIVVSVHEREVPLELVLGAQPAQLLELALERDRDAFHGDRPARLGGEERGGERGIADDAAGHPELAGEEVVVEAAERGAGRE